MYVRVGALQAHLGRVYSRCLERGGALGRGEAAVRDQIGAQAEFPGIGGELLEVAPEEGLASRKGEEGYLGLVLEYPEYPLPFTGRELLSGLSLRHAGGGAGGLAAAIAGF
jgi:hypothetical protein